MYRNSYWLAFLVVVLGVVVWFVGGASYSLYRYWSLGSQAPATITTWSIDKLDDSIYMASATYTFSVEGVEYQGKTSFDEQPYRNVWAAEETVRPMTELSWVVWYSKSTPQDSSLQHSFPTRQTISALILLGILLYLAGLGYYVKRRSS